MKEEMRNTNETAGQGREPQRGLRYSHTTRLVELTNLELLFLLFHQAIHLCGSMWAARWGFNLELIFSSCSFSWERDHKTVFSELDWHRAFSPTDHNTFTSSLLLVSSPSIISSKFLSLLAGLALTAAPLHKLFVKNPEKIMQIWKVFAPVNSYMNLIYKVFCCWYESEN